MEGAKREHSCVVVNRAPGKLVTQYRSVKWELCSLPKESLPRSDKVGTIEAFRVLKHVHKQKG